MPKIKGAKKALRQNIKRRAQNIDRTKKLKAVLKGYLKLIEAKKFDEASKQLSVVYKALDKSAKVNLIKKNKASRLKARLTKRLKDSSK